MYRYLLFHCDWYYPVGGMNDCVLKTNNFDDLVPFINENYYDTLMDGIHYYDTVEDKHMRAVMLQYENEDCFTRQRFIRWEDASNE